MEREEKIIAYILGELTPSERVEFDLLLEQDSTLQKELKAYTEAISSLDKVGNELPSENLNERFDSFLSMEIKDQKGNGSSKVRKLQPLKWMSIAASILVAGFFVNQSMQSTTTLNESTGINPAWTQTVSTGKTSQRIQAINEIAKVKELDLDVIEAIKSVIYNDQSSNVRLAAVESLSNYIEQEEVKEVLIEALNTIETPIVKIEIINILTQNEDEKAKDTFEKMLAKDDLNETVRKELHTNIRKLETII